MSSASAIYSKFGPDSVDVITDDPYILTEKIRGFTFAEADKIAMSLDIPYNSAKRINAGILWQLDLIVSEGGHLFYPYSELVLIAAGQLGVNEEEVENCLEILSKEQKIVIETVEPYGKVVYQQRIYEFERFVKSKFDKLSDESFPFERNFFEDAIDSFEKSENITMGDMQKEAVEMAGTKGLLVITGGPGTGKTTIIKAVTRYFDMLGLKTVLTAPTGRAAKRITES
jgi:exodeoxyribonuclease V alpha subunit